MNQSNTPWTRKWKFNNDRENNKPSLHSKTGRSPQDIFPTELWLYILDHLSQEKATLKSVALANKMFRPIAQKYLFSSVYLDYSPRSWSILQSPIARYIKYLTVKTHPHHIERRHKLWVTSNSQAGLRKVVQVKNEEKEKRLHRANIDYFNKYLVLIVKIINDVDPKIVWLDPFSILDLGEVQVPGPAKAKVPY